MKPAADTDAVFSSSRRFTELVTFLSCFELRMSKTGSSISDQEIPPVSDVEGLQERHALRHQRRTLFKLDEVVVHAPCFCGGKYGLPIHHPLT